MNREHHKWYSPNLGRDMELLVHGTGGVPFMIFPCSNGRFYDFEDRKMFETVRSEIFHGKAIFFSVDGIDWETWHNYVDFAGGAARHKDYDNYIVNEVIPFIHNYLGNNERVIAGGASMGAYHAVNFFLRHPEFFGGTLAMSGNYHLKHFFGDYSDDNVYYNSPLSYMPNMENQWYLDWYRKSKIIISTGQGAWEETMVEDTRELEGIFKDKGIPAFFDYWGHDVNHDWPWWEKQFPHFVRMLV